MSAAPRTPSVEDAYVSFVLSLAPTTPERGPIELLDALASSALAAGGMSATDPEATPGDGLADRAESFARAMMMDIGSASCASPACLAELLVPIAASTFALAAPEDERTTVAVLAGLEVGVRIAETILTIGSERCWSATWTAAAISSGLAGARALGLDHEQTTSALSLATTQAPTFEIPTTPGIRPLRAGWVSAAGVAATLAARGAIMGPSHPLTGPNGLFHVLRLEHDERILLAGLDATTRLAGLSDSRREGQWADCRCGQHEREDCP